MADQIETQPAEGTTPAAPPAEAPAPVAEAPAAPPEVAGEQPPPVDPDILGSLTQDELGALSSLRQRTMQITTEIGQMEVRKARMLGVLSEMEDNAQRVVQGAGKRLGITDGQQFQVLPDGRLKKTGGPFIPPPPTVPATA